jgi:serine/threonine protein kinase
MSSSPPLVVADRYRLVAPLGQGGMGRVWRATDVVLHRDVAIKELVPPPGLTPGERQEMRERSLREARAIARLNNVNVVRVFDVLRTDADPWIVMEYVDSRSLHDTLAADGPFHPVRAAEIGLGVLGALRAAHRAGVVHRDVKPGNVLIGADGRVVLTDFGLATVPGDPNVTRTGLVLGSPAYIAPERARDGTAGPAADLWSLGATLYAAVEGSSPFARPSAIATLAALATENPPPSRNAGPLKPVLNGLLRKDPTHRINAEEAERLLLRATGRRSKLTFPMSPTMRRPGVGRERPALPPTGATPVVPGPRPPVPPSRSANSPGQAPVSGGRPAAGGGRPPVFVPGKAQVGRPVDQPTRVDGPKADASRLEPTRVDGPPVRDSQPLSGTRQAPPPPAATPAGSAPHDVDPALLRTVRGGGPGGFTAADVAANRRRKAAPEHERTLSDAAAMGSVADATTVVPPTANKPRTGRTATPPADATTVVPSPATKGRKPAVSAPPADATTVVPSPAKLADATTVVPPPVKRTTPAPPADATTVVPPPAKPTTESSAEPPVVDATTVVPRPDSEHKTTESTPEPTVEPAVTEAAAATSTSTDEAETSTDEAGTGTDEAETSTDEAGAGVDEVRVDEAGVNENSVNENSVNENSINDVRADKAKADGGGAIDETAPEPAATDKKATATRTAAAKRQRRGKIETTPVVEAPPAVEATEQPARDTEQPARDTEQPARKEEQAAAAEGAAAVIGESADEPEMTPAAETAEPTAEPVHGTAGNDETADGQDAAGPIEDVADAEPAAPRPARLALPLPRKSKRKTADADERPAMPSDLPPFSPAARPAWKPMQVSPPIRKAGGVTVFGTRLTYRQAAIGAAALLVVLLLVIVLAVKAFGGGGDKPTANPAARTTTASGAGAAPTKAAPGASATPSGTPSGVPSTQPSSVPATSSTPSSPPVTGGSIALPAGWKWYSQPTRGQSPGFTIPIPQNASISPSGSEIYLRWNNRLLIVDRTDAPQADPVQDWKNQEANRTYRDYHKIKIVAVNYFKAGADWEFTYTTDNGNAQHADKRNVLVSNSAAYSLNWYTTPEDWAAAQSDIQLIYRGFQPKP